ncbi:hypothetical protein MVEN_00300700 [Mycena venus]|uniref:Fucose-specific lectin n=1 Tax=Mycena venus TaxID=2733690 RepID=A0A8H6YZ25_9AGAR|nr:hypothetical protein MVEN_00300700 [Mycena venus]
MKLTSTGAVRSWYITTAGKWVVLQLAPMSLILGLVWALIGSTFLFQAEAALPTPEFVKIFPAGNIAVVQTQQGSDTRLFFQLPNGTIRWEAINGPFVTGTLYDGGNLVPAEEAALGTPMAAVSSGTTAFDEIRLYFVSPLQHPQRIHI